jgi:C4-type Zn-finger protein
MLRKMRIAREQNPNFTLAIKDPLGNSAIVSSQPGRVKKQTLTKSELLKLKFGQYALVSKSKPGLQLPDEL